MISMKIIGKNASLAIPPDFMYNKIAITIGRNDGIEAFVYRLTLFSFFK